MATRRIKCILGPHAGRYFYVDPHQGYLVVPQWPDVDIRTALEMVHGHHTMTDQATVQQVVYEITKIRWKDEVIQVLVPSEYLKQEGQLDAMIVEAFFR